MDAENSENRWSPPVGPCPLDPTIAWGEPTDVVPLYRGPLTLVRSGVRAAPRKGSIDLLMRSGSSMVWQVDLAGVDYDERRYWRNRGDDHDVTLEIAQGSGGSVELPAFITSDGRGILRPTSPGSSSPDAKTIRAVAYALPSLFGGQTLVQHLEDGGWQEWSGRHTYRADQWELLIESRHELDRHLAEAKRERLFIGTHVVQIRRRDDFHIAGPEANELLTAVTFGLSFALGRWVGLLHAQGWSAKDEPVWTQWGPLHAEAPHRGSTRWWNEQRPEDLGSFLAVLLPRWLESPDRQPLSFLLTSALAAGEGVFVEQRLLTIMAALEHYWWAFARAKEIPMAPDSTGQDGEAARQLRGLLTAASVSLELPSHQSELSAYAGDHNLRDVPHVLTYVRNRLTHPKMTEQMYARPGLVAEAARLARRCLDLILLWELGYTGHACDGTRLHRWTGESEPVPWVRADKDEG